MVGEQIPREEEFIAEAVEDTVVELEPWIKEQASTLTYATYDYLKGRSQSLKVIISLETVKDSLRDNARQAFLQSPPPELAGASPAQLEQAFNEHYQEFSENIPSTFEFDESSIPAEAQEPIGQVRQAIDYFDLGYKLLIGFMLLLILGIILINRNVKITTLSLGITFLSYGILECVGIFVAKRLAETQLTRFDLPSVLEAWLPQLIRDLLAPLEMFNIGVAVAGVALIIVSVVYKPKPAF